MSKYTPSKEAKYKVGQIFGVHFDYMEKDEFRTHEIGKVYAPNSEDSDLIDLVGEKTNDWVYVATDGDTYATQQSIEEGKVSKIMPDKEITRLTISDKSVYEKHKSEIDKIKKPTHEHGEYVDFDFFDEPADRKLLAYFKEHLPSGKWYGSDEDGEEYRKDKLEKGGKAGHERFKKGMKVKVDEAYLKDEASPKEATAIATVMSEPSDEEELVMIQYENGSIDYLGQDWLEPAKTWIVEGGGLGKPLEVVEVSKRDAIEHAISVLRPVFGTQPKNKFKVVEKKGKGGSIGVSKFWNGFVDDGALITGGSYFDTEKKDFGGTVLGILFGGGLGYIFGASTKQRGYPAKLKTEWNDESLPVAQREVVHYMWKDNDSGWVKMTEKEFKILTKGNLYKYNHNKAIWNLKIFEKGGKVGGYDSETIEAIRSWGDHDWYYVNPKDVLTLWEKHGIYAHDLSDDSEFLLDESRSSDDVQELIDDGGFAFFSEYKIKGYDHPEIFEEGMAKGGSIHHKKYSQKHVNMTKRGRGIDSKVPAKKAGWRKSKETGNWYFESRKNRSDANPRKKV